MHSDGDTAGNITLWLPVTAGRLLRFGRRDDA